MKLSTSLVLTPQPARKMRPRAVFLMPVMYAEVRRIFPFLPAFSGAGDVVITQPGNHRPARVTEDRSGLGLVSGNAVEGLDDAPPLEGGHLVVAWRGRSVEPDLRVAGRGLQRRPHLLDREVLGQDRPLP